MDSSDVVIVGGIACGTKAAATLARRLPGARITLFQKEDYLSCASCGLPWLASGDLTGPEALLMTPYGTIRDAGFFESTRGVTAVTGAEVLAIDRSFKTVQVKLSSGDIITHGYDSLVLATGAHASLPPFPCPSSDRILPFHTLDDALRVRGLAESGQIGEAVIVGAGLVGVEMTVALTDLWGVDVTLIERENRVLPFVLDKEMADMVERHMSEQGVAVLTGASIDKIVTDNDHRPVVHLADGSTIETDLVLCCLGVTPNVALAEAAGLEIGKTGAIAVDRHLRTSDPSIYAGGDCVETTHRLTDDRIYMSMGSLANRHGRVIAENIAGNDTIFKGSVGTFIVKVFELNVGTVGISQRVAEQYVIDASSVWGTFGDRPDYYLEHESLTAKMVYHRETDHLLGLQAVGTGDIARRLDVFSVYLHHRDRVADLFDHEHAYAPPFAEALDPLHHLAALAVARKRCNSFVAPDLTATYADTVLLDVREPDEADLEPLPSAVTAQYAATVNVPLDQLSKRLDQVPNDRPLHVLCKRGPRAYLAIAILKKHGYTNASLLAGGLQAVS